MQTTMTDYKIDVASVADAMIFWSRDSPLVLLPKSLYFLLELVQFLSGVVVVVVLDVLVSLRLVQLRLDLAQLGLAELQLRLDLIFLSVRSVQSYLQLLNLKQLKCFSKIFQKSINSNDRVYRMVIVEGCRTITRSSSFRSKLFIG